MSDVLDINAFMNFVSTQAYFANVDFPYNNVAMWFDKQGTKKWRWILKDLDAFGINKAFLFPELEHQASYIRETILDLDNENE